MKDKNLGFILEFSKGARMEHTVTIPLVQGSSFRRLFMNKRPFELLEKDAYSTKCCSFRLPSFSLYGIL